MHYVISNDSTAREAIDYLWKADPVMAKAIKQYGPYTVRPHKNYYQELVDSIISQQLSVKAAATIEKRFCALFDDTDFPSPEQILTKSIEELRTAGLSRGKAMYVRDLAQHVVDGKVKFDHLDNLSNDEVIKELTAVKGVGEWTAHMFLLFCMGRMNVLAYGDLGVRNGIQKIYELKDVPSPQKVMDVAKKHHWHPYESVACWYVWQSLDNAPAL